MFTRDEVVTQGLEGFVTWSRLLHDEIPSLPGVYDVLYESRETPELLGPSAAGRFKDRDPTASRATLQAAWVDGAPVVYIGKTAQPRTRLR